MPSVTSAKKPIRRSFITNRASHPANRPLINQTIACIDSSAFTYLSCRLSRICELVRSSKLDLIQSFGRRVKGLEFPGQIVVSIINGIRIMKYLQLFCCGGSPADEGIEIDYLIPVFVPEEHNRHGFSWLARLNQR